MIYLDNAATTKVSEEVFAAIKPFFCEQYANPSAIYRFAGNRAADDRGAGGKPAEGQMKGFYGYGGKISGFLPDR